MLSSTSQLRFFLQVPPRLNVTPQLFQQPSFKYATSTNSALFLTNHTIFNYSVLYPTVIFIALLNIKQYNKGCFVFIAEMITTIQIILLQRALFLWVGTGLL